MGFLGGLMDGFSLSADFQTGHANKYEVSAYDAYTKKQAVVTAGFIDNVFGCTRHRFWGCKLHRKIDCTLHQFFLCLTKDIVTYGPDIGGTQLRP